ncbi:SCO2521 family protein [Rugosimonospora africana]|uniref:Uncharacterized protein n=1 Tax=Rugosimonospora africana TaxID=556532 RepID=A0A8J3VND1_9ACTN|nr:SCO2521 family protein [Rugosimonospora africana]GIH12088.1 hypothetical protein Raf01_02600 [Rugosimonospora africana]
MLMLGEVSTGLLRHSTSVSARIADDIMMLRQDQPVRSSRRPIAHAVSQDLLTGVDCRLPIGTVGGPRCVGTVRSHAAMTGGRVLQGSAYVSVTPSQHNRRLPWSYYLSCPGIVETIGAGRLPEVAAGFASQQQSGSLDLGSIGTRVMNAVQDSPHLDGRLPFRMARTVLRWMVAPTDLAIRDSASVQFTVDGESRRTLVLRLDIGPPGPTPERVVELCEDLALHDWLLTALEELIDRSQIGSGPPAAVVDRLKPAIDQLLHLWMPAARLEPALAELWQSLERRPGFSRQWKAGVDRVRDQLTASTIALLSEASFGPVRP